MELREPPPADPGEYTAYLWLVDADRDPATGQHWNDIGSDFNVRLYYDHLHGSGWHPVVDRIHYGDVVSATDFSITDNTVSVTVHLALVDNPDGLDFVAATIATPGGDIAPNSGHGDLPVTPLPPDAIEKPSLVCLSPPILVLAPDGTATDQITPLAWDDSGNLMDLQWKALDFWGGNATVAVDGQGNVTAIRPQESLNEISFVFGAVNGVASENACVVHVLHTDPSLDYVELRGRYVWYFLPREWAGVSFEQVWSTYEAVKVTDAAYVLEHELTGVVPFHGAPQFIIGAPADRDPMAVCGISGNPLRLGIALHQPFPNNNCIRDPNGRPHHGVIWHEVGHNFTGGSVPWYQLYGGDFLYSEGMATLCGMYAAAEMVRAPSRFALSGQPLQAVSEYHDSYQYFLQRLSDYEAAGANFSLIDPDVLDGIFLRLADQHGWAIYPAFFQILLPYDQPWAFLDDVRAGGKVHTFTVCALSVVVGQDLRDQFRAWNFPIDDAYYQVVSQEILQRIGAPTAQHELPATGHYMISFPLSPLAATVHDLLCDDLGHGSYYMWGWQSGGYQTIPTSPPGCQTSTLSIDEGYWVLAAATTIGMRGIQHITDETIPLQAGWNMIAAPYEAEMDSLLVDNAGDVRSLEEAQAAGWVLGTFYYSHDGTGSYSTVTTGQTPADTLSLWHGYWALAGLDCSLILPPPFGGAGATAIRALRKTPMEPVWTFDIRASSASFADTITIAAADGASDAFDGFPLDRPKPPSRPGEHRLRTVLTPDAPFVGRGCPSPPAFATSSPLPTSELAMETKGATQDAAEWQFTVTGGIKGEPVMLTWPELGRLPKDRVAILTDPDTGKRTFMRTRARYEFMAPGDGSRRSFAVTVKPAQQAGVLISSFSAVPLRGGGAELTFSLSADAAVSLEVLNVAGRLVQRIRGGVQAEAGRHMAAWHGRSLSGAALPNGLYLCVLMAKAADGRQARAVRPISLSR